MLNAETPRLKFALYGAHSSLGNALLCELLTRQHEAVALVDDLNSMTDRPGLR
ncbi:MAG TPA: NADH-flavin reductase, partial [Pseudomonas sp.]|nr:NADH-flavin reductase [Pseudomonas sp.]